MQLFGGQAAPTSVLVLFFMTREVGLHLSKAITKLSNTIYSNNPQE